MVRVVFGLVVAIGLSPQCLGRTILVDISGTPGVGDVEFIEIQPAIDAAEDGDEVLVRPGEYVITEPIDFNRLYAGSPDDPGQPPPRNLILRSEAGPDSTTIRMSESPADSDRQSVVVFEHDEDRSSVLEGFSLTGGQSSEGAIPGQSGGILCTASPTIRQCVVTEVDCRQYNCAGAQVIGGAPLFVDCTFFANRGQGVQCEQSSAEFRTCTISGNSSGGILAFEADLTLEECRIAGNGGAGVTASTGASASIRSCLITGNFGDGIRGGYEAVINVEDCDLAYNYHAGIACDDGPRLDIARCSISGNRGPGISTDDATTVEASHCTISGNHFGVGLYAYVSISFESCIIWQNLEGAFQGDLDSNLEVRFSCVQGGEVWPGEGNIADPPDFCAWGDLPEVYVDASQPESGDGHAESPFSSLPPALEYGLALAEDSPCRGAGGGGTDMGNDEGTCPTSGAPERLLHLAPGTYVVRGQTLAYGVSIGGSGAESTILEGGVYGLRTGAYLTDVTVTTSSDTGITVVGGESPEIRRVRVTANRFGGIQCLDSSVAVFDSMIYGNFLRAVYNQRGFLSLTNCCVWGNWSNINGAGVHTWGGSLSLTNCSVVGNLATRWGTAGVVCDSGGTATVINSIVWDNTPQVVCGQASYSLLDQDPLFVEAGVVDFDRNTQKDVGGFTLEFPDYVIEPPDLHLQPESPAIDAGTCEGAPDQDLEGNPRPAGLTCDIGAYEYAPPVFPATFIRGDVNGDGSVDLSDPVYTLLFQFSAGSPPTCLDAADSDDTGNIELTDAIYLLSYLFLRGPPPMEPFLACGPDVTPDALTCASFRPCE